MTNAEMQELLDSLYDIAPKHKDDIIADKEIIKYRLCNDIRIRKLLHNVSIDAEANFTPKGFKNLSPADLYLDTNIISRLWIPETQQNTGNLICFDVEDLDDGRLGRAGTIKQLNFLVLVDQKDMKVKDYGYDRHDLIGYVIRDLFNWSNCLGLQIREESSKVEILDNGYYCRIIRFLGDSVNGLENGGTFNVHD